LGLAPRKGIHFSLFTIKDSMGFNNPVVVPMNNLLESVLSTLLILFFVLSVVTGAWYLLWTFILAPNPLVRDFFDLDKVETVERKKER
jgi:hypothetical protein